ncbi:MAG TPA: DUF2938 domain-containing protein [Aquabacterium sp.]|nr:DUF2938 domain-containing protein [Aquabacterium sp.]
MTWLQQTVLIVLIGIGATAVMDLWLMLLKRLRVPTQGFDIIGRWVGHLLRGRLRHEAIGRSPPIPGELALGWATHYAVGIGFAAVLVVLQGPAWMARPTAHAALLVGVCTVLLPWLVMQPAMGAGWAASKTPTPFKNCLRNLANHTVFGLGLYLSAVLVGPVLTHPWPL